MADTAEFDAVVWGATGFTGRLVAEEFVARGAGLRWALGGRDRDKLAAVRDLIGAPPDTALVVADAGDRGSLDALVDRAGMVLTTVGPYHRYGSRLVEACAASGTDYLDLCGEPLWMRQVIDAQETTARATGARIVLACGFDSVPFELGVQELQRKAVETWGSPLPQVRARVGVTGSAGFSGGSFASFAAETRAGTADATSREMAADPFVLTPGFRGPDQPLPTGPRYDEDLELWLVPWVLAPITQRNLHRSNALRAHAWGEDFTYEEMMIAGPGEQGRATAESIMAMMTAALDAPPRRPGEGPDRAARESASYQIMLIGSDGGQRLLTTVVTGEGDPGYLSTARIMSEAAHCLRDDVPAMPGGVWTPCALMGGPLIGRLTAHAAMTLRTGA